jgi:hypothetical protein
MNKYFFVNALIIDFIQKGRKWPDATLNCLSTIMIHNVTITLEISL